MNTDAARIDALTREVERLRSENRRLTIALDDSLDREEAHALDASRERLAALPGARWGEAITWQSHTCATNNRRPVR